MQNADCRRCKRSEEHTNHKFQRNFPNGSFFQRHCGRMCVCVCLHMGWREKKLISPVDLQPPDGIYGHSIHIRPIRKRRTITSAPQKYLFFYYDFHKIINITCLRLPTLFFVLLLRRCIPFERWKRPSLPSAFKYLTSGKQKKRQTAWLNTYKSLYDVRSKPIFGRRNSSSFSFGFCLLWPNWISKHWISRTEYKMHIRMLLTNEDESVWCTKLCECKECNLV